MQPTMPRFAKKTVLATFAIVILLAALFAGCATTSQSKKEVTLKELIQKRDLEGIRKFYQNQEQLNEPDDQGLYPLHIAVIQGDVQIAEILIVLGAKPDNKDLSGKTPLRYAVDRKQVDMVKMLVDRGADPFVADVGGATPAYVPCTQI